jgi:hypothetical protein
MLGFPGVELLASSGQGFGFARQKPSNASANEFGTITRFPCKNPPAKPLVGD